MLTLQPTEFTQSFDAVEVICKIALHHALDLTEDLSSELYCGCLTLARSRLLSYFLPHPCLRYYAMQPRPFERTVRSFILGAQNFTRTSTGPRPTPLPLCELPPTSQLWQTHKSGRVDSQEVAILSCASASKCLMIVSILGRKGVTRSRTGMYAVGDASTLARGMASSAHTEPSVRQTALWYRQAAFWHA
jgi:hypothetical protein